VLVHDLGARNGVATFLYDETRVSDLRLQVVQETHPWSRTDSWGQVAMAYVPGAIADEGASRARYAEELKREIPIKSWSSLVSVAQAALAGFDGDASLDDISANGLVVDGVVYVRGCNTRYGPFPYCRHMRHGVFSVTKSLGAAVALLRLAQKYGDGVLDLKIKDYVQVTAAHDGWERVTFGDALNMATGIGDNMPQREPLDVNADNWTPRLFEWGRARTALEKLRVSFAYGKYPWGPGEIVRYNNTHTFVLAAAMDSLLKQRAGANTHLWDMVVDEVFRPIGVFHAPMLHTLEADGSRGIPLLSAGLYPTIDDIAKLTMLFQNGGRHEGRQLLSAARVTEALYRAAATGLPTGRKNRFGDERYHLSFWSVPYRTQTGCFFQIPYMSGLGGNLVVLLPNGISAFRFADGNNYDAESMVPAGEALRPFCPSSAVGPTSPPPGSRLTERELRVELVGKAFRTGRQELSFEAGGRLSGTIGDDFDVGTWEIMPDGRYCRTWNVWDGRRSRCYTVHRVGEMLEIYVEGRWGKAVLERR
jgi:CubicO group peptidase (beta-lactamase class C family)